ncbi:DNA-3-methyladenine glycosylase [Cryobacterium sp. Y82]|uniref:DNA-3-methyladenine glycosylase n=1 Tax=Cryobacterium sp. Y82 TaxID=2045017 RepID=UPI000CE35BF0|nr:DNA-3-methyladenine glycosylase [Cryobacterium sp. Y82]
MGVLDGFHRADRKFFSREVFDVAPELLGSILQRTDDDGTVTIRITEIEAYAGERDPGAHSYRGMTNRNRTMFGPAGHLYCYFTYGMHHAVNLVTGDPGQPYGCLIRAGDVIEGSDIARSRRERTPRKIPLLDSSLARGPGCLAQSLGATLDNDGDDLFGGQWKFFIPDAGVVLPHRTGPRVGVSGPGGNATDFPWRYWLADASSVSTYKPGRSSPRP